MKSLCAICHQFMHLKRMPTHSHTWPVCPPTSPYFGRTLLRHRMLDGGHTGWQPRHRRGHTIRWVQTLVGEGGDLLHCAACFSAHAHVARSQAQYHLLLCLFVGGGGRSSICLQRRRALAACVLLLHSRRAPGGQKLQARESALKPHARESALTVSLAVAMQAAAASKAQSAQPASASESPGDQGEPCAGAHGQVASGCAHAPAPQ